jgi:hypothetical protein
MYNAMAETDVSKFLEWVHLPFWKLFAEITCAMPITRIAQNTTGRMISKKMNE